MALDYKTEYQRYRHYYTYLSPFFGNPVFRACFALIISLVTVAIFLAFAIRPAVTTIIELRGEIAQKQALLKKLDDKVDVLSKLQIQYRTVEPELPAVSVAVPTLPLTPEDIVLLEKASAVSGVSLEGMAAGPASYDNQPAKAAIPVEIKFSAVGDFAQLQNFSRVLISLPRLFAPTAMMMTTNQAPGTASAGGQLIQNWDINSYYLP